MAVHDIRGTSLRSTRLYEGTALVDIQCKSTRVAGEKNQLFQIVPLKFMFCFVVTENVVIFLCNPFTIVFTLIFHVPGVGSTQVFFSP